MRAAIEMSVRGSLSGGVLAGYPLVDVGATLVGVTYVEGESTEGAFGSAAVIAFQALFAGRRAACCWSR